MRVYSGDKSRVDYLEDAPARAESVSSCHSLAQIHPTNRDIVRGYCARCRTGSGACIVDVLHSMLREASGQVR